MDQVEGKWSITEFFKQYRWASLVILVGLIFMAIPEKGQQTLPQPETTSKQTLQQELEELLSSMQGAGKVKVLLTTAEGEQTYYQTDEDVKRTEESTDSRGQTVRITAADRSESGLIRRIDPPVYQGAVVLCQGADKPAVKLAVVDAVSTATGLTSDKIAVWKMK